MVYDIPDQKTINGEYYNYYVPQIMFSDNDPDDELTISANLASGEEFPDWLTFDSELNKFYGTPYEVQEIEITVTATDIFEQSISQIFSLAVLETISIQENLFEETYVYPNPTNGKLSIDRPKEGKSVVSIISLSGKIVKLIEIYNKHSEIDLGNLSEGVYFIEINTEGSIYRLKAVLQ